MLHFRIFSKNIHNKCYFHASLYRDIIRCIESRAINHISKTFVNRDTDARHRYPIRYKLLFSFSSIEFLPKKKKNVLNNDIMSSTPPFQCYRSSQELEGGRLPPNSTAREVGEHRFGEN